MLPLRLRLRLRLRIFLVVKIPTLLCVCQGGKLTLFDGGMRVNAFAYSAGWLPDANGRVERGLLHITDTLPTFVGLGGGQLTGSNGKLYVITTRV